MFNNGLQAIDVFQTLYSEKLEQLENALRGH